MRYAVIESGAVTNVIVAPEGFTLPGAVLVPVEESDPVFSGCLYRDGVFVPPPPAPPVIPTKVTPRQAQIALAMRPATDGVSPHLLAQVENGLNGLPEPQRTIADITWKRSMEIQRYNPLITQLQGMLRMTDAQIDALFIAAAQIP